MYDLLWKHEILLIVLYFYNLKLKQHLHQKTKVYYYHNYNHNFCAIIYQKIVIDINKSIIHDV